MKKYKKNVFFNIKQNSMENDNESKIIFNYHHKILIICDLHIRHSAWKKNSNILFCY